MAARQGTDRYPHGGNFTGIGSVTAANPANSLSQGLSASAASWLTILPELSARRE